jgi:hypothetical protein
MNLGQARSVLKELKPGLTIGLIGYPRPEAKILPRQSVFGAIVNGRICNDYSLGRD